MSKESPSIDFNPLNPKYKKVADLPTKYQSDYVDVPIERGAGFVKRITNISDTSNDSDKAEEFDAFRRAVIDELSKLIAEKDDLELSVFSRRLNDIFDSTFENWYVKARDILGSDKEFICKVAIIDPKRAIEMADDKLKSDPDVILEVVTGYPQVIEELSSKIRDYLLKDRDFIVSLVKKNGRVIEYLSEILRDDERVLLEAIKTWPEALKFASVIFTKNPEFLAKAVMANPLCLEFAPVEFKEEVNKNRKLIEELIDIEPRILLLVDKKYLSDKKLVHRAVEINGEVITSVDRKLITEDLLLDAVGTFPSIFSSLGLTDDFIFHLGSNFFEKAVQNNGLFIGEIIYIIKTKMRFYNVLSKIEAQKIFETFSKLFPYELFFEAIRNNGLALKFFVEQRFMGKPGEYQWIENKYFERLSLCLNSGRDDFSMEAVKENGLALQFAPNDVKKNRDICMRAIIQNPEAIKFVDESIRGELEEFISRMHVDQSSDDGQKMAA